MHRYLGHFFWNKQITGGSPHLWRRFQGYLLHSWAHEANDQYVAHLQTKTVPKNLIWSELVQWLWSSSVPQDSRSPYHTHEHAHNAVMSKWSWCCICTVQDSSIELDLEWIGPVVAEFWRPQNSRNPYHAYGHAHYAPMGKWPWRYTSTGKYGSKELDLKWIGHVVPQFRRRHDSRTPYHANRHTHYATMGWTNGQTDWLTNGWKPFHSPPFFPSERAGDNYCQVNTTRPHWWLVIIGLVNGLLTEFYDPISVTRPQWYKSSKVYSEI